MNDTEKYKDVLLLSSILVRLSFARHVDVLTVRRYKLLSFLSERGSKSSFMTMDGLCTT